MLANPRFGRTFAELLGPSFTNNHYGQPEINQIQLTSVPVDVLGYVRGMDALARSNNVREAGFSV
jgi:hypothetical protein